MRIEKHNLHGTGARNHEVYDMPALSRHDYWASVTDVPCPVEGCKQQVLWYEAGYVPGYRVCMAPLGANNYDAGTLKHRFRAAGNAKHPRLIRDDCCE